MAFQTRQIAPPQSWNDFEDLCLALFREIWQDPMAQKHGHPGQAQQGVDIFGTNRANGGQLYGVACIAQTQLTQSEIEQHVSQAELFSPALAQFILATTAPADVKVQEFIRQLSAERQRQGKFLVSVLDWELFLLYCANILRLAGSFILIFFLMPLNPWCRHAK